MRVEASEIVRAILASVDSRPNEETYAFGHGGYLQYDVQTGTLIPRAHCASQHVRLITPDGTFYGERALQEYDRRKQERQQTEEERYGRCPLAI